MRVQEGIVCVEVRDTGRGISAEFLPRVFDRYAQEVRGKREPPGLGLSIARTIVGLHGGSLSAKSAGEGKGSSFSVTLPRATGPAGLNS